MIDVQTLAIVFACAGTGALFGVDLFAALVVTPSLRLVDDRVMTMQMGSLHEVAALRMPFVFVFTVASAIAGIALNGASLLLGGGLALLVGWVTLLVRKVLPLNDRLRDAHAQEIVPDDARAIQRQWDRLIGLRLTLLTVAFACFLLRLAGG